GLPAARLAARVGVAARSRVAAGVALAGRLAAGRGRAAGRGGLARDPPRLLDAHLVLLAHRHLLADRAGHHLRDAVGHLHADGVRHRLAVRLADHARRRVDALLHAGGAFDERPAGGLGVVALQAADVDARAAGAAAVGPGGDTVAHVHVAATHRAGGGVRDLL